MNPTQASPSVFRALTRRELIILLVPGLALVVLFGDWGRYGPTELILFVAAAGLLLVTPLVRGIGALLDCLRDPSPRALRMITLVVIAIAFAVLIGVPMMRGYSFHPRSHDEQMHQLQMQMLARGRLWMPPHPLGPFFESFFVFAAAPYYGAIYFPGASLMFTPQVWLGLPYWFLPVLYSAIAVGLLYRVIAMVADGVAALLAVMLVLSLTMFREMALATTSHNATLMLVLAVTFAWLKWRAAVNASARHAWRWAAVAGALAGLAAITRPVEAICYVVPLAVASIFMLRRMTRHNAVKTVLAAVLAAMPFVAIQLVFDKGTTGRWFYTPYQLYLATQQPGSSFGFHRVADDAEPESQLAQKRLYYEKFVRPAVQRHRPELFMMNFLVERLRVLVMTTLPHPFVAVFVFIGLVGLRYGRDPTAHVAVWAALPMLMLAYAFNAFLMAHYMVIWVAPIALMVVSAPEVLARTFPRWAGAMPAAAFLFMTAAAIAAQPGVNPRATEQFQTPVVSDAREKLAAIPHPALVFFTFDPEGDFDDEPVYNIETAWPDDARVVRAHDFGPARDLELVRYYAARQPARVVYVYDQATRQLQEIGPAADLAAAVGATP